MSGNHNEAYEPQNFMHVGNSCAGNFFLQFLSYLPLIRLVARLSFLQRQKRQCRRVLRATQKRLRSGGSQRLSPVLDRWRPLGRDTSGLLLQNTDFGGENCEERPHLAVYDTGELVIQEWKRNDNNGNSSASSNEVWGASSKQVPATMSCIKILMVLALQFIVNHTLACFPVGHLNYSPGLKEALGQQGVFWEEQGGKRRTEGCATWMAWLVLSYKSCVFVYHDLDDMVGTFS